MKPAASSPKVLVLTVGGSPDPIVNAIRKQDSLAHVYFLCSSMAHGQGSIESITKRTKRASRFECTHCGKSVRVDQMLEPIAPRARLEEERYSVFTVDDPDDLGDIQAVCAEIRDDIRERFDGQPVEIVANYTGGTKTMSLGIGLFALQQVPPWHLQVNVSGPGRKNLTAITHGDIPLLQDSTGVLTDARLETARNHAASFEYQAAADVLAKALIERSLSRERRIQVMEELRGYEMWAAWDRFDYTEALEVAKESKALKKEHARTLSALKRTASLLQADDVWGDPQLTGAELVLDLVENARRSARRKRFDDAIGRLYRATELLAQVRLRKQHEILTGDIHLDHPRLPAAAQEWLSKVPRAGTDERIKIGLNAAYQLLGDLEDPLGAHWKKADSWLRGCLETRNQSLFAHGLTSITEVQWTKFGVRWSAWIEEGCSRLNSGK